MSNLYFGPAECLAFLYRLAENRMRQDDDCVAVEGDCNWALRRMLAVIAAEMNLSESDMEIARAAMEDKIAVSLGDS